MTTTLPEDVRLRLAARPVPPLSGRDYADGWKEAMGIDPNILDESRYVDGRRLDACKTRGALLRAIDAHLNGEYHYGDKGDYSYGAADAVTERVRQMDAGASCS